jgi:flavin-dependent dehydrogenase
VNKLTNYIKHHGIKGQKWGVRRFQKEDGSLTPAGEKRYTLKNTRFSESVSINGEVFRVYGLNKKKNKKYVDDIAKRAREKGAQVERGVDVKKTKPKKSEKQIKLEEQYMAKGVSPKDAADAARKRLKAEALIAASAAVVITSGGPQQVIADKSVKALAQKAVVAFAVYEAMAPKDKKKK